MITKERIILGVDPGTQVMGYGVLRVVNNKPELITMGILQLNNKDDHYLKLRRIFEYIPLKIKMSITGNGRAAKEQVAYMLQNFLRIPNEKMIPQLDATDGLAAAVCHYFQTNKPSQEKQFNSWKDFINKNPDKVKNK